MTRIAPEALPYQSPLDQVLYGPTPVLLRLWPAIAAGFLVLLVSVSAVLQVDVVVTAPGRVVTDAPPVVLKPMVPAVLLSLDVRPGDAVAEGQVLAQLDPRFTEADLAAARATRAALSAQIARIEAEIAGRPLVIISPELELQARIMSERAAVRRAELSGQEAQLRQIAEALQAAEAAQPGLEEALAVARDIEETRATLYERETISRLALQEAQIRRLDAQAARDANLSNIISLREQHIGAEAALSARASDWQRQLVEELAALRPRMAEAEEQMGKAADYVAMSRITAPVAGVVVSVAQGGPGSLIASGEPVVTLVPAEGPLLAEIRLRSADVGQVAPGDPVVIKVDAFPWRRHGLLEGTLSEVAPTSSVPEGGSEALHPARAALAPGGPALTPGMTLVAEVTVGRRSILDFFLDPLSRGLRESLREP